MADVYLKKQAVFLCCKVGSVQFSSVTQSCSTLCDPMDCSTPGLPVHHQHWSLLKLMAIELVMPSNHLILCPLLLLSSIFPSIRAFSNESALHMRQPKYWSFSFNISPSNEYSGLFPFRMNWLDLLAKQGRRQLYMSYVLKFSAKESTTKNFVKFFMSGVKAMVVSVKVKILLGVTHEGFFTMNFLWLEALPQRHEFRTAKFQYFK